MSDNLRFLHIIDSPSGRDFLSERREGLALEALFGLRPDASAVRANVLTAVSKDMLVEAVESTLATMRYIKKTQPQVEYYPVLHFACHASGMGVEITGNGVKWDELAVILKPLSTETGGKLLLCFAACEGLNAEKMNAPGEKRLFEAIIAPTKEIYSDEVTIAFSLFYHLFLTKGVKLKTAVKAMNIASAAADVFQFCPADVSDMVFPTARHTP